LSDVLYLVADCKFLPIALVYMLQDSYELIAVVGGAVVMISSSDVVSERLS